MAWIEIIAESEASSELADLYRRVRDPKTGALDRIMSIHSLHPDGLKAHFELYRTVMTGSESLPEVDREMIALVVSCLNSCHY